MIVVRESVHRTVVKVLRIVGFENIARVNQGIRDYYNQKNLQVAEINLIRESKQKLSGYILLR